MRLLLYPFFSQQNKLSGLFKLGSDSGVRHYVYIAEQAIKAGWDVSFVLPCKEQIDSMDIAVPGQIIRAPYLEACNMKRRLQWMPSFLSSLEADIVLTQHEHIAIPLRMLQPKLKIVMECGLLPETAYAATEQLFPLAWASADLVHCTNETCKSRVKRISKASLWEFGYDDREAKLNIDRDIDVLFNARSSSTNYSKHRLFMATFNTTTLNVAMTDPTGYLKQQGMDKFVHPAPSRQEYVRLLSRSKVVVSLLPAGCSAYSFREAIYHGCIPVCLKHADNVALLGESWPCYIDRSISAAVAKALEYGKAPKISCSWSNAWMQAEEDLCSLL